MSLYWPVSEERKIEEKKIEKLDRLEPEKNLSCPWDIYSKTQLIRSLVQELKVENVENYPVWDCHKKLSDLVMADLNLTTDSSLCQSLLHPTFH